MAILPLNEHNWLKWSCDKHNRERRNTWRFRVIT